VFTVAPLSDFIPNHASKTAQREKRNGQSDGVMFKVANERFDGNALSETQKAPERCAPKGFSKDLEILNLERD
jgi:hypothetical protein